MIIHLTAVEPDLADAWQQFCGDLPDVTIHRGSIFDIPCDAVVSPANSFGFMDGGIDFLYSRRFGWHVQEQLQELIRTHHHGELLVGAAEIVETHAAIPFLIAAPTMRVPMILRDSINPYLDARAALLLVQHGVLRPAHSRARALRKWFQAWRFPAWAQVWARSGRRCARIRCEWPSKMYC